MKLAFVGIVGAVFGVLLAHMGFGYETWEFWMCMVCIVAYSVAVHLYIVS